MRAKPLVGVTTSLDPGLRLRAGVDYAYLKRSYARAIHAAGGIPLLLTPDAVAGDVLASCDALVISGGDDLPSRTSPDGSLAAPTAEGTVPEVAERTRWERDLIDGFRGAGRPLLAICYGMQLLNLHLGGTLHESYPGGLDHGGAGRFTEHAVVLRGAHAAFEKGPDMLQVSSCHRQCVDRVAPELETLALASDGVVEAVGTGTLLGVEWHPEADATGEAVYGWLVRRAASAR